MIPNVLWRVEFLVVTIGQLLSSVLLPAPVLSFCWRWRSGAGMADKADSSTLTLWELI